MKKILILAGGYSNEKEISLKTAKSVYKELSKDKKKILKVINPNGDLIKKIKKFKPNLVLNLLHGRYGEDGYIQSILETLEIKYTHSGVLSSMLAMDKEASKQIFVKNKILTPMFIKIKNNLEKIDFKKIKEIINYPLIVKPNNEGSSLDVYICNNKKTLLKKIKKMKNYSEFLIEKFIPGREIQVAIMGNRKLGAIELKPRRKFYDYKAKYSSKAKTEHIIPVKLSSKNYESVKKIALKAHKLLKCRGITRSDFKFYNNKFYLLEINTQPGLTNLSLVPEIAAYKSINFRSLINWMIKDASTNR